jgi:thiosulfate/3-mercaptopyruvate sulfurtransferase
MDRSRSAAQVMVDPAWIAAHLDDPDVRLIEVDVSPALYDAGHIPGAMLWNAYSDLRHAGDYTPLARDEVERLLSRSGLTPETTIVFYGYGNYLGFWLLQAYGHRDVRVMDGGRERFEATGVGWTRNVPAPAPSAYVLPDATAHLHPDRDEVQAMLGQPDVVLLDVRSKEEFDGERFWPSGATAGAGRAGRLPGALHLPADALRTEQDEWKRPEELRQLFEQAGIRPERSTVAYCTIGNRASQAWFALTYLLGHPDAGVYYGSWSEWGTRTDTPLEP